jgi:predicted O-methyltransferase YrrM/tetratricopeptide (TPR) repeat protein
METIRLNGLDYTVKKGEFIIEPHLEYNNLKIYPEVGRLERIIGLLNDLVEKRTKPRLLVYGWTHGGFIPVGCAKLYEEVIVNTAENITLSANYPSNIYFNVSCNPDVIYLSKGSTLDLKAADLERAYVVCARSDIERLPHVIKIPLAGSDLVVCAPNELFTEFNDNFSYYFDADNNFKYDNLIHLCIMVKNAGPLFETVLTENLPFIDRWTILDTGSTDGTQELAKRILAKKKGALYEEPFINFRESRNRCLDLAGRRCKYLLMLDDTYAMRGDLRKFLEVVRGDQFASSYSLLILSDDVEYYSNRVTMSERGLRYIYTIHEVIQDTGNKQNVVIPKEAAFIHDHRADYMEKRTMDRKQYDLKLLYDMVREDPDNPRHYYYLAQTYNLLEDYENAAYWFKRRATTSLKGHDQEAVDSWFELARIYNFKLNKPWEECKATYDECYKKDPSRPDALYFIGVHYFLEGDKKEAFNYFKRAFDLGYPIHAQFSLKPTLSFHFLPKFLAQLCYEFNEWRLGLEACRRFMGNNKVGCDSYEVMRSWLNIFELLCMVPDGVYNVPPEPAKPIVVFVADGGWGPWTGSDILTKGVGGSETYIIEIARWIQKAGRFQCVVFCKCEKPELFEGVQYIPLSVYPEYIMKNKIHTAIVSRFSEYIPLTYVGFIDNVYLVLHDLGPSGLVIPMHNKLKKVLCLTNWHVEHFLKNFPAFEGKTEAFYYGIDRARFDVSGDNHKVPNSFIYSSFPNRGLLPLLQMWPAIKKAIPDATLNVYSDVNGKWVNEVAKEQMDEIRRILAGGGLEGVTVHGWVSKADLAVAWRRADIWLYPCIFQETFCLTALEAAATKTLAIGAPLAALQETIGDRGILVEGDPMTAEWQSRALKELLAVLGDGERRASLIARNYEWACSISWKTRGEEFARLYLGADGVTDVKKLERIVEVKEEEDGEAEEEIADRVQEEDEDLKGLNLANMKNWVHDLPSGAGHRDKFLAALARANPKRVLEIGTFAGTSLIKILRLYPDAKGVAIDRWKNYDEFGAEILSTMEEDDIERIFYENLLKAGVSDRVTALKGDSVEMLLRLHQNKERFDFIYVDGSHTCLDCYTDMVLSWGLLECGGVLAVDDVLYHYDRVFAGEVLEYPLRGKEHFMRKYAGQYEVISDSYRLFLIKL